MNNAAKTAIDQVVAGTAEVECHLLAIRDAVDEVERAWEEYDEQVGLDLRRVHLHLALRFRGVLAEFVVGRLTYLVRAAGTGPGCHIRSSLEADKVGEQDQATVIASHQEQERQVARRSA